MPDGAIPWTAVALYAEKKELDPDNSDVLWDVIRLMDQAERAWIIEDLKSNNGGGDGGA